MNRWIIALFCFCLCCTSCVKDDYVYQVNNEVITPPNAVKTKLKTNEQYIAILYTNLFQKPMSVNNLIAASNVIQSIGDKEFAHDQIVGNFMNSPEVLLPSDEEMREDLVGFIELCYNRFYTRHPSALEMQHFLDYIEGNADVTPEMVYYSFATSDEYLYY